MNQLPDSPQNWIAYFVAASWSAASHWPVRQQAMPLKNVDDEQIHTMSVAWHPPILEPEVNWSTHVLCEVSISTSAS
jgi:hypothetical protein